MCLCCWIWNLFLDKEFHNVGQFFNGLGPLFNIRGLNIQFSTRVKIPPYTNVQFFLNIPNSNRNLIKSQEKFCLYILIFDLKRNTVKTCINTRM